MNSRPNHILIRLIIILAVSGLSCTVAFGQAPTPAVAQNSSLPQASTQDISYDLSPPPVAPKNGLGFFAEWEERARETLAHQPSWPIPLVTGSSGLVQVFRQDFVRQVASVGTDTWIYGNTKGLNLVPWYNVEFDAFIPPYIQHNSAAKDGFGDFCMLLKYRLAAADASHGNYSFSVSLASTLPTGSYHNGAPVALLTPTIYAGKGFGRFDVQSTVAGTLPAGETATLGRVLAWNTVAQYHIAKLFWPEVEDNASFYYGGRNDGRVQNFLTPGLILSKFKFQRESSSLSGLAFGAGMQIATSHFHTYNHALVFTARLCF